METFDKSKKYTEKMIALVTSTLIPNGMYSLYTPEERLRQTQYTLERLTDVGFKEIYIFDNSIAPITLTELTTVNSSVKIYQSPQYTFKNKGLNEALLILNNIHHLPKDVSIFKISGRYYPNSAFSSTVFDDCEKAFLGIGYYFDKKVGDFSTKAYFVKNSTTLESTLVTAVEDMVSYSKGIHGFKSAVDAITGIFKPRLETPYQLSIEQSFARILRQQNNFKLINKMNIDGFEATASRPSLFTE